jgi:hypothetical protein
MIRYYFDPRQLVGPDRTEWLHWEEDARTATKAVIAAYEEWRNNNSNRKFLYEFDDEIWKRLRDFMLHRVFYGKCAYCETREIRSPYHAEHFRPKGMVRFKALNGKALQKAMVEAEGGVTVEHPGYFWLAYHWKNLLPSCAFCNAHLGKKNQFPIAGNSYILTSRLESADLSQLKAAPFTSGMDPSLYYLLSDDLDQFENPLLLHPLMDDPREYICFGDCGEVASVDSNLKGAHSIAVYDLCAEALRRERQRAQEEGENRYMMAKASCRDARMSTREAAGVHAMESFVQGREAYSAAVLDYLEIAQAVKFNRSSTPGIG